MEPTSQNLEKLETPVPEPKSLDVRLTPNFWLSEFLRSQTATRHGISMNPSMPIVRHLYQLAYQFLQPLREDLGSAIYISSGWRPLQLNQLIGGSEGSAHIQGLAADIRSATLDPEALFEHIGRLFNDYDQLILEFDSWVHLATHDQYTEPRGQMLRAVRRRGRVRYYQVTRE